MQHEALWTSFWRRSRGRLRSRPYKWINSLRVLTRPKPLRFNLDFRLLFGRFHPCNANKINGLLAHYRYFLLTKSSTSKFISVRISDTHFLTVADLDPRRRIIGSMGKSIRKGNDQSPVPGHRILISLVPKVVVNRA